MRISDWSSDVCSSDLFGRSECQRVAVVVAVLDDAVIAERPEAVAERLHAVDDEGADGGNVQRAGERLADADRPLEAVVVILRHIEARGGIELNRAVVQDRGVRKGVVEGKGVSVRVDLGGRVNIKKK